MTGGAQLDAGKNIFGEDFGRLSGFVRYSQNAPRFYAHAADDAYDSSPGTHRFVVAGGSYSLRRYDVSDGASPVEDFESTGAHIGIGARRQMTQRSDLGVRLEFDDVDGRSLIAIRVLDYRYRFRKPFALTVFAGAARYEARTPAHGYYGGLGVQWLDVLPGFDLSFEGRYADRVVRNKDFPGEYNPPGPSAPLTQQGYPNEYSDFFIGTLSLGYRF